MGHYDDNYAADAERRCKVIRKEISQSLEKFQTPESLLKVQSMIENYDAICKVARLVGSLAK